MVLVILYILFPLALNVGAFQSAHESHQRSRPRACRYFAGLRRSSASSDDVGSSDDSESIDATRKRLEILLGTGNASDSSSGVGDQEEETHSLSQLLRSDELKLPPPPPLSVISKENRLVEIQLLKQLPDGDDATSDLWSLWYAERGSKAQTLLEQADRFMGAPSSWQHCEELLTRIIHEYGVYFVEPVNRLATLYFLQGKLDASYRLCTAILEIKPWHFGALAGIVQVCIKKGDREEARLWAERRLPSHVSSTSFPPFAEDGPENPRRSEWVEDMIAKAEQRLREAEKRTQSKLGKAEEYYKNINIKDKIDPSTENKDEWQ